MKFYRLNTKKWSIERAIYLIGGSFTLTGVILGFFINPYFFMLSGLVGSMQIIFAFTGLCPMAIFLKNIGLSEL